MALTLVKSPAAVSQVGNDILFRINTNNMYSTAGTQAYIGLLWNTGDTAGKYFKIAWDIHEITFTSAASPNNSGLQYPAYSSGSLEDWMKSLIPYFQANYLLSRYFDIAWNNSANVVQFKALTKASKYTLTFTAGTSNATQDANVAGVDPVAREFYQLYVRVWESYPQLHKLLGEDLLVPDADGNCDFKIQEYLAGEIKSGFTYPVQPSTFLMARHAEMCITYFIQYTETYANEFGGLISTDTTETVVIPGKLPLSRIQYLESIEKTFFDFIHEKKKFLSWYPGNKTVSEDQPEKLYFLNHSKAYTLYLKTTAYYGGNAMELTSYNIVSNVHEVLEISCGYKDLELDTLGFDIHSYKLQITTDLSFESEPRTFIVDKSHPVHERIFMFMNSFGVYETLRTTGQGSKTNQFEYEVIEQTTTYNPEQYNRGRHNLLKEETFICNTGWISQEELDWMNDFLLSPEVYLVESGEMIPVILTSKKVFQHKDKEYLYSVDFEYSKSELTPVHAGKIEF